MSMKKETLILKTQIELSTHRVKVLKAFDDADVLRPTEIGMLSGMNPNNVSRSLGQLKQLGLVKLVSSKGRARHYALTDKGSYIIDYVDDQE